MIQVGSMNGEIVEKIVRKTVGNIEDKAICGNNQNIERCQDKRCKISLIVLVCSIFFIVSLSCH